MKKRTSRKQEKGKQEKGTQFINCAGNDQGLDNRQPKREIPEQEKGTQGKKRGRKEKGTQLIDMNQHEMIRRATVL